MESRPSNVPCDKVGRYNAQVRHISSIQSHDVRDEEDVRDEREEREDGNAAFLEAERAEREEGNILNTAIDVSILIWSSGRADEASLLLLLSQNRSTCIYWGCESYECDVD